MLKNKFQTLCQNYTSNQTLINALWQEIKKKHSEPTRYYHTLKHLEQFYTELQEFDTVIEFSIFYHDIIYDVSYKDNEEQSASLCQKIMEELNIPFQTIKEVVQLINETKMHKATLKRNALFLDTDLAILGSSREIYEKYTNNVRKEYAIYSDAIYTKCRKSVLEHFLEEDKIYQSHYFYEKYEKKARDNLGNEIMGLK